MDKLSKQLVKLGEEEEGLRKHLRPILKKIAASGRIDPLGYDYLGRPLYLAEQVFGENSYVRDHQTRSIDRKYRLAQRHGANGKLKELVEKVLGITLVGDFKEERSDSTGGIVLDADEEDGQAWARILFSMPSPNIKVSDHQMSKFSKMVSKIYSLDNICHAQADALSVYRGQLFVEITWWGAIWEEDIVADYRERLAEEARIQAEKERRRLRREEEERRKSDPLVIQANIVSDLERALRNLDTYGGRHITTPTIENGIIYGSYRSDLPEDYISDDDEWSDGEGVSEYEYDELVSNETARAEQYLDDWLMAYGDHIESISAYAGDKNYIEVSVHLK